MDRQCIHPCESYPIFQFSCCVFFAALSFLSHTSLSSFFLSLSFIYSLFLLVFRTLSLPLSFSFSFCLGFKMFFLVLCMKLNPSLSSHNISLYLSPFLKLFLQLSMVPTSISFSFSLSLRLNILLISFAFVCFKLRPHFLNHRDFLLSILASIPCTVPPSLLSLFLSRTLCFYHSSLLISCICISFHPTSYSYYITVFFSISLSISLSLCYFLSSHFLFFFLRPFSLLLSC